MECLLILGDCYLVNENVEEATRRFDLFFEDLTNVGNQTLHLIKGALDGLLAANKREQIVYY